MLQDLTDRHIGQRRRALDLFFAANRHSPAYPSITRCDLEAEPMLDQAVPRIRLHTLALRGFSHGNQHRIMQPPDGALAVARDRLGPQLIAIATQASRSIVPQRTGQNRRLPVSSRR